ncbi:MAG: addiction module antidote protein [Candidatus Omnitrophota bacterium]
MNDAGREKRLKKLEGYRDFRAYFVKDLRDHPEDIDGYLEIVIEDYEKDRDAAAFLLALRTIAEAKEGMTSLAKKTNLTRQALYKALSSKGNPRLETIWLILNALGYSISIKPSPAAQ